MNVGSTTATQTGKVQQATSVSMLKKVMALQEETMETLMESVKPAQGSRTATFGIGNHVDVSV